MRRSLYLKFLLGYILFGLVSFLCIGFFSSQMIQRYLIRENASRLYSEAVYMAGIYEDRGYYKHDIESSVGDDINMVANFLGARIWVTDAEGRIVLDSEHGQAVDLLITDYDPSLAGHEGSGYRIGYYYGMFTSEMLSVEVPINYNYAPIGYIIMHYPMSRVEASTIEIQNIVYLTGIIIFLLSLLLLIIFTIYVYIPIKAITKGASEFAKGNFDYQISAERHHDEIGTLAHTMNFMASHIKDTEASQRAFISNVSHDFRSPLTSIRGYLEAMLDGTIPPELYERYIRRVISETDRLKKLTEGILSLESLDARNRLKRSAFDINRTIRDVCNSNENACTKKNINFELTFADETEMVYADYGKIQQVLYNLIDNAIKFSDNDSTIYIRSTVRQHKVYISVKDTGIGIPKNQVNKIWDRFYKTDLSRGKDKTGTGLGLSIVKEILSAHHETIDVISTEGIGTEFIFSLPLYYTSVET